MNKENKIKLFFKNAKTYVYLKKFIITQHSVHKKT